MSVSPSLPPTVLWGPSHNWIEAARASLVDLWRYRDLLVNFVIRDVRLRYQGTMFGFLWCLLSPLLLTLIFTLLFTVFMSSASIRNFPLFALIGLLAWNFHATAVGGAIQSITANSALLTKTHFPRELLPLSIVLANAVNFLFTLPILLGFMVFFQLPFTSALILFPVALLIQVAFLTGFALIFSTLNVFFRDTGIIMESLMLAWFFLTPIFYQPSDLFPEYQRLLYLVNPVASVVAIYRDILYFSSMPDPAFLLRTAAQALALMVLGWAVFSRFSDRFVEEL